METAKFGTWTINFKELCFEHLEPRYQIPLKACSTSAQVLHWIFQIYEKSWGKESIGDLIEAIHVVLNPQETLCSCGQERGPVKWAREEIEAAYKAHESSVRRDNTGSSYFQSVLGPESDR